MAQRIIQSNDTQGSGLLSAIDELDKELPDAAPQTNSQASPSAPAIQPSSIPEVSGNPMKQQLQDGDFFSDLAAGATQGIGEAVLETKDFVFGEPEQADKSAIRKQFEANSEVVRQEGGVTPNIALSVSQFTTGMIGLGNFKLAKDAGVAAKGAFEIGKAAVVGAVAFDPHEERLSNLVQSYPALQNPVSEYLAANPADTNAEGRFKAAIESIGMDVALGGVFLLTLKATKALRSGDEAAGRKFLKAADKARQREATIKSAAETNTDANFEELLGETPAQQPKLEVSQPNAAPSEGSARDVLDVASSKPERGLQVERSVASAIPAQQPRGRSGKPVEVSADELGRIVAKTGEDLEALTKYGGREEAIAQGHKFNSPNLPWQKLRAATEVQSFVDNVAATMKPQMDAKKGGAVMSDARVSQRVGTYADLFGEDPAMIMGELADAGAQAPQMVAKMEAAYLVANKMFQDTYKLAFDIKNGMLDEFGGDAALANEELIARLGASTDMLATAKSISSNSGRALRRMRSVNQLSQEQLDGLKGLDGNHLVDALMKSEGDPKKLAEAANPSWLKRVLDGAQYSLTNSLLWLYPTHVVNTVTNGYMLMARPMEKLIGAKLQGNSVLARKAAMEYSYTVSAMSDAWDEALAAFTRGDSTLSPHSDDFFEQGGGRIKGDAIPWSEMKTVDGMLENLSKASFYVSGAKNLVGLPTRALGAMDEFFKTMRYRAVVQADASVDAIEAGLSGKEYADFMQARMNAAFDDNGRGLNAKALQEAEVSTFQQELLSGTAGNAVRNARSNWQPLGFILPFVKTPVNVLRYSWKMTPGLNLLQTEYQQMLRGKMGNEQQAQAMGQMVMGSIGMGIAANLVLSGRITGGGPEDPKLRKELIGSGWQPYSYKFAGTDGKVRYFPLGRFDPVGMVFGMVADVVEMTTLHPNSSDNEKGAMAIGIALAKNFSEKSFLLNFNQALRAFTNPEQNMAKFSGGLAGNTIPFSSAIRGYANQDPYLRDARGFVDNMLRNMPGYSGTLPPVRNALGEPVWKQIGLTKIDQTDEVEAELNRIILETGHGLTPPAPTRNGVDLRDVVLANGQTAYDRFQELAAEPKQGKRLKDRLLNTIQDRRYLLLPDGDASTRGTKLYALAGIVSKFRRAAFAHLRRENKDLRQQLVQKQLDVISQLRTNRAKGKAGRLDQVQAFKDALNIN